MSNQDIEKAQQELEKWFLGKTSKQYESGKSGAATISTGKGDHGGVSYGSYQLSTNAGTLKDFLNKTNNYNHEFDGLVPKTKAFNEKWVALANNDPAFGKAQHDFVVASHYEPQMKELEKAGFKFSERGKAIQDMVWSTAVQYGDKTVKVVKRAQEESGLDFQTAADKEIISAVQDSKRRHVHTDFRSSSEAVRDSIKNNRIPDEKANLLKLDGYENLIKEYEKNKGKEESAQSKYDEVHAMIQGLLNDKDGSFAKKLLADNQDIVDAFDAKVQASIEQDKQRQIQTAQQMQEVERETVTHGFGRSFG